MYGDVHAMGHLQSRGSELLPMLEQLVGINSHTPNVAGVNAVGGLIKQMLSDAQLRLTVTHAKHLGDHLCFSTAASHTAPHVLIVGHHDTVFPPGTFEGFYVRGGLAHGPGALDMKGGLVIIMAVLRALSDAGVLAELPIKFVSVSDEEIGSPHSRTLLAQLAKDARCALVFEAGRDGDRIITRRRGSGSARVTAQGKASHAGSAFTDGRNAIWALSKYIDRVQALNGSIPGAAASVGLVQGGTARNTVPEEAQCDIDLRFTDAPGQNALIAALQEAGIAAGHAVEGTRIQVNVEISREPLVETEASAALCARYGECQRLSGLGSGATPIIGGGSDANTVAALGVPAIDGLGPRGSGFHTRQEQIEVGSLMMKAEALLRFLLSELRS